MAIGDDLSAMLPPPPPPRPMRRDGAIAAALRRFDGEPDVADRVAPAARSGRLHTRRAGVLASVLLVAMIGVPATLIGLRNQPIDEVGEATSAPVATVPQQPTAAPPPTAPPSGELAMEAAPPIPDAVQRRDVPAELQAKLAPAPTASFAVQERSAAAGVVADVPVLAPPPPPTPPSAAPAMQAPTKPRAIANRVEEAGAADASEIVVTGARIRSEADWRDDEAAVRANERAVGVLLDRALAYQRQGKLDLALAELNRAYRRAPNDGRILRQRGALYRQLGDTRRAERDERRLRQLADE